VPRSTGTAASPSACRAARMLLAMPKSRRRPRPSRTVRRKAPVTWQAAVLHRATSLLEPTTTRHDVEVWASALLAEVAAREPLVFRRRTRDAWVTAMLRYADRRRTPAAAALVLALRTVLDLPQDEDRSWPSEVLRELPWTDASPHPQAVWLGSDAWEDQRLWFLEYPDHVLLVCTRRAGLARVTDLQLAPREAITGWDALAAAHPDGLVPCVGLDVDDALATLATLSAVQRRLVHWRGAEAQRLGHLLDARLRGRERQAEPRTSDEERSQLIRAFADDTGLDLFTAQEFYEPLLDYAVDHMDGDPLLWSPALVEDFLMEAMPFALVDVDLLPLMPSATSLWVSWALTRRGLSPAAVLMASDVAMEVAGAFRSACEDELLERGYEPEEFPLAWRRSAA